MADLSTLVGKRIREIRESKSIKQVELANMIDIEPTNLSKIEKGMHLPKDETIQKILIALNIELNELFDFGHHFSREKLLKKINDILKETQYKDLQFFYRVLISYNEINGKKN